MRVGYGYTQSNQASHSLEIRLPQINQVELKETTQELAVTFTGEPEFATFKCISIDVVKDKDSMISTSSFLKTNTVQLTIEQNQEVQMLKVPNIQRQINQPSDGINQQIVVYYTVSN